MLTASLDGLSPGLSGFSGCYTFYWVLLSALSFPEAVFPVFSIFPSRVVCICAGTYSSLSAAACLIVIAFVLLPSLPTASWGDSLGPLILVCSW